MDFNNYKYSPDFTHIDNDSLRIIKDEVINTHEKLNLWYKSAYNSTFINYNDKWKISRGWDLSKSEIETKVSEYLHGSMQDSIKGCSLLTNELKSQSLTFCKETKELYNLAGVLAQDKELNYHTSFGLIYDSPEVPYYEYRNRIHQDYSYVVEYEDPNMPKVAPSKWHECLQEMISFTDHKTAILAIPGFNFDYLTPKSEAIIFIYEKENNKWLLSALYDLVYEKKNE